MSRSMFSYACVLGPTFSTCFMPSSMHLCAPCHVYVPRSRPCWSCHVLLQPFCRFVFLSCVLAKWFGLDLDLVVFVIIRTPWPISKGLDHPYLHVYACLLLYFMFVLASLVLGFAVLDALRGLDLGWLYLTPIRLCSDVTIQEASPNAGCSLCTLPFSALCNDMLVCATRWLYVHLYTLAYMSMHESCLLVCHPYLNTMKL